MSDVRRRDRMEMARAILHSPGMLQNMADLAVRRAEVGAGSTVAAPRFSVVELSTVTDALVALVVEFAGKVCDGIEALP